MTIDMFLSFPTPAKTNQANITIIGESQDAKHPGAIEIKAFDFGLQNPVTIGSTGMGKAAFTPFKFIKTVDRSSPLFFEAIGLSAHFDRAVLALRKSAGAGVAPGDYAVYTFGLVYVTSQETTASLGDETPTETIQLVFGNMSVQYHLSDGSGNFVGNPIGGGWDQVKNGPPPGG